MNRRNFIKSAGAVPVIGLSMPESLALSSYPTPTTAKKLEMAINDIFEKIMDSKQAFEVLGDGVSVRHLTYCSGVKDKPEGWGDDSIWFLSEKAAVENLWSIVKSIRDGSREPTKEMTEDKRVYAPCSRVIMRRIPETKDNGNGCVSVSFRASFIV